MWFRASFSVRIGLSTGAGISQMSDMLHAGQVSPDETLHLAEP